MNTLNYLSARLQRRRCPDAGATLQPEIDEFARLADLVELQRSENQRLRDQAQKDESELVNLKTRFADLQKSFREASNRIESMTAEAKNSEQAHLRQLQQFYGQTDHVKSLDTALAKQRNKNKALQNQIKALEGAATLRNGLVAEAVQMRALLADAHFETERLRYAARGRLEWEMEERDEEDPEPELKAPRLRSTPEAPYVVLLWAPSIFRQGGKHHRPGTFAANEIYQTISDDIAKNHPEIGAVYKIVVRVFFNARASQTRQGTYSQFTYNPVEFRRQFVETFFLFDYIDAGQGKERVDYKIRENFNLCVTDPRCRHIFLAVCKDNSFARMLEGYQHDAARQKLTLVAPGYVQWELWDMHFRTVVWANVFRTQLMPKDSLEKRRRQVLQSSREASEALQWDTGLGHTGTVNKMLASNIIYMLDEQWQDKLENRAREYSERSRGVFAHEICSKLPVFAGSVVEEVD
ncbi:uncharacterized protein AB675_11733 [Cyphellophora attinorum]|uniref:DUF7923 domain-containing protein n=1 Tax=Cyphellophora attinorum TaxID=1664694 RepID=A0A0N1H2F5_9EURO|nr:uncharacterized protein AB675_11733 [Phialophora attinorum]KPI35382.1 hypothetical protein AB675_11733 [Phialophora attinorum]